MIFAITSEGLEQSSLVSDTFGRAPFIIFYDLENKTFESLHNPYAKLLGAGIQTAQFIIEKNAGVVIANDIGLNPLRLLKSANVEVYSCAKKSVLAVVKEFSEAKLSIINQTVPHSSGTRINDKRKI